MSELGEIPEEWEIKKIKDIANICYGKSQKEVEVEDGKYKILGTGGVIGYTNDFLWNRPSVLIGRKGTIDKPQYIEEPFWTVDTLFYTKINENYIAKWFYYYLDNIDLKKYNEATGVPSLSVANLNTIRIATPTKKEQEKIASILSTVDEQIDNVDALIEKNKELKKGLMQTLLTKGIGHTKFKKTEIGEIPEEWKIKKLDECINTQTGFPFKSEMFNENEGLPLIRIRDILKSNISTFYSGEYNKEYIVNYDDILISMDGDFNIAKWKNIKGLLNQRICRVFERESISRNYIFYVLNVVLKAIERATPSTTVKHLVIKDLVNTKIAVPTLEEQNIIGNTLLSIDKKIEEYKNKKQKLEELKKGLMQQLLTGKIRVI